MKLSGKVEIKDFLGNNHFVDVKSDKLAGIIPVYKRKRDAVKASEKGKYEILKITSKS